MGAALAGVLVALGNIIRLAVQGKLISWSQSLASYAVVVVLGLILLPLVRLAIDRFIMTPGHSLTREEVGKDVPNIGAGASRAASLSPSLTGWCF